MNIFKKRKKKDKPRSKVYRTPEQEKELDYDGHNDDEIAKFLAEEGITEKLLSDCGFEEDPFQWTLRDHIKIHEDVFMSNCCGCNHHRGSNGCSGCNASGIEKEIKTGRSSDYAIICRDYSKII